MSTTAFAPRLRRSAFGAIARSRGARLCLPPASSRVQSGLPIEAAALPLSLARYIAGWAQADPAMIAGAAIDGYRFHDPLAGAFTAQRLSCYFEFLHARFDCAGAPAQPAFHLRGPMDGCAQGLFAFKGRTVEA